MTAPVSVRNIICRTDYTGRKDEEGRPICHIDG